MDDGAGCSADSKNVRVPKWYGDCTSVLTFWRRLCCRLWPCACAMWDSPHGIDQTSLDACGKATEVECFGEFTILHLHDFVSKNTEKDIRHGSPP